MITALIIAYLAIGALVATAYFVFAAGITYGSARGEDYLATFDLFLFWLPKLVWTIVKLALLILLPMRITNHLFPVKY